MSIPGYEPPNLLYFIVAQVGPGNRHRPLAVTRRRFPYVFNGCKQVISILCAAENAAIIRAELSLAAGFYRGEDGNGLPAPLGSEYAYHSEVVWDEDIREFPFLSTALLLGLSENDDGTTPSAYWRPQPLPLGTPLSTDVLANGMIVIDISEPESIQYGIVVFGALPGISGEGMIFKVMSPPDKTPGFTDGMDDIPCRHYTDGESVELLKDLQAFYRKDAAAMDYLWPSSHGIAKLLSQQAIRTLIKSTQDVEERFIMSGFATALKLPHFPATIRQQLLDSPNTLGPAPAAGQLLRLAFSGQKELNWAPFRNLSYEAVADAIESSELEGATSLAICVTRMQGDPGIFLQALDRTETLRMIYFLEEPRRITDNASKELFLYMSASATHTEMLQNKTITWSCSYSAPLRKRFWLPTTGYRPPPQVYPVQQMFTRRQLRVKGCKKFQPSYSYIGDGLLGPEAFAAGFLWYLSSFTLDMSSFALDNQLLRFSRGPHSLGGSRGGPMGPLLAEVFSVPFHAPSSLRNECWTKPRDLDEDSWTVLVSVDFCKERDPEHWPRSARRRPAQIVRYAFVRARRRIAVDSGPIDTRDLEISDLVEFLRITAPHIPRDVVKKQLDKVSRDVAIQSSPAPLDSGESWVSVLDGAAACSLLQDFLEDAAFIRENLRHELVESMGDWPEYAEAWYPELLESVNILDMEPPKRRRDDFVSMEEYGIESQMEEEEGF